MRKNSLNITIKEKDQIVNADIADNAAIDESKLNLHYSTHPDSAESDPIFVASEAYHFTNGDKNKLDGIPADAEKNVQVDWNSIDTEADDFIKNKPTIPDVSIYAEKTNVLELTNVAEFTPNNDYEPATKKYVDDLTNLPGGLDTAIQFNDDGVMNGVEAFEYDKVAGSVKIGEDIVLLPDNPLAIQRDVDSYLQINLRNMSDHADASSDYIVTADTGDDTQGYGDFGIGNSGYASEAWDVAAPLDTYIFGDGGNIVVGSLTPTKSIKLFVAQTEHEAHPADVVAEFDVDGMNLPSGLAYRVNDVDIRQSEFDRHSSGLVSGGELSAGSPNTTLTVASGIGWAWNGTEFVRVVWNAFTNQSVSLHLYVYVAIYFDGTLNLSNTEQTSSGYIRLGHFYRNTVTENLDPFWPTPERIGDYQKLNNTFVSDIFGTIIKSGFIVSEQANPNELKLSISAGTLYAKLSPKTYTIKTTFNKLLFSTDQGISRDWANDNNTIDTTLWNDHTEPFATALVAMTTNYWAKALVTISIDGAVSYIYPEAEYATEDEAKAAAIPLLGQLKADGNAPLVTIVFKKSDASIANEIYDIRPIMERAFGTATTIAGGTVVDHGTLTGLADDDHEQYLNESRANTWLGTRTLDDIDDGTNYHALSTAEQTKLTGIEAGAEVNNISDVNATDLTDSGATTLHKHSYNNLDDLPSSGTPATTVVSETSYSQAVIVGTSTNYAREDHSHGTPAAGGGGVSASLALAYAIAL